MPDEQEAIKKMAALKPRWCKHGSKVGAGYICGRCLDEKKQGGGRVGG